MPLLNGLVVMTPSSVAKTGTGSTATINSNGSVVFADCETLSLNGVFTSSYDNYMIVLRFTTSLGGVIHGRLRLSGTDSTSTSDYNSQFIRTNDTTISGSRSTGNGYWWCASTSDTTMSSGYSCYIFGPNLAQPTAYRAISAENNQGARIYDFCGTHELSTAYDGISFFQSLGTMSGLFTVFGFNQ